MTNSDHRVVAGSVETPALPWRPRVRPPALGHWLTFHPVLIGQIVLEPELSAGSR